jgi:hypothetical protein
LVLLYALRGGSYDVVAYEEVGLGIWWVLAIAFGLGLLPRTRPPRAALALVGALAAYSLWTGLSLIWTQSSELTIEELARSLDYLGVVTLLGASLDRRTWRAAAAGLGLGAGIVCVFALGTRLAPQVFPTDYVDSAFHIDRISYPFGYWNAVGAWGAMSIAIGLAWSAHDSSRARRAIALALIPVAGAMTYLSYSRAAVGGAALAVLAVLALGRSRITALIHVVVAATAAGVVVAVIRHFPEIAHATGTRGAATASIALLLAAAACAVTAVLTAAGGTDRWRVPRAVFRPLAGVCAVIVVIAAAAVGPRVVKRGWHSFTATTITTGVDPTARLASLSGSRYPLWQVTLSAFDAHPLNGTGAGTFEFWWDQHATTPEFVRDAHNVWLENMAELGLPGLILIIAIALTALVVGAAARIRARRTVSAGVSAAFLAAFSVYLLHASVDWMWESTAVTVLALAGIAVVGARGAIRPMRLRLPGRALLAALATFAGLVQLPGLLSTASIRRSQAAERVGDVSAALGWAKAGVDAEPWSASAHEQRGLVLEGARELPQAAQELDRAIAREPTNFRHWVVLARIDTERGRLGAAVSDYNRAYQLRPLGRIFQLAQFFEQLQRAQARH